MYPKIAKLVIWHINQYLFSNFVVVCCMLCFWNHYTTLEILYYMDVRYMYFFILRIKVKFQITKFPMQTHPRNTLSP